MAKQPIICSACNFTYYRWNYEIQSFVQPFVCQKCFRSQRIEKHCLFCNKVFDSRIKEQRKFCSQACAAKLNNSQRDKKYFSELNKRTKQAICTNCKNEFLVSIHSKAKFNYCQNCVELPSTQLDKKTTYALSRLHKNKNCKWCGQEVKGQQIHEFCKKPAQLYKSLKYFISFENILGTNEFKKTIQQAINLLKKEYWDNNLCLQEICDKYGYSDAGTLGSFISRNRLFKLRKRGEAVSQAYFKGRKSLQNSFTFKTGYHTTWDKKIVHYRSSYELEYYKILDEQKVTYLVENFRIPYYDTVLKRQRIAIPDIFIPETNELIEIKSDFKYNEQNIKDRFQAYSALGYKYKLIFNKKETKILI